jgi:small subunit ribosomal protein S17
MSGDPGTGGKRPEAAARRARKAVIGVVTSDAMQKTISVRVDRIVKHPVFEKYVRRASVFKAHDEQGAAKKGDTVEIVECRPLSKTKRFRLVRVVKKARHVAADLAEGA